MVARYRQLAEQAKLLKAKHDLATTELPARVVTQLEALEQRLAAGDERLERAEAAVVQQLAVAEADKQRSLDELALLQTRSDLELQAARGAAQDASTAKSEIEGKLRTLIEKKAEQKLSKLSALSESSLARDAGDSSPNSGAKRKREILKVGAVLFETAPTALEPALEKK